MASPYRRFRQVGEPLTVTGDAKTHWGVILLVVAALVFAIPALIMSSVLTAKPVPDPLTVQTLTVSGNQTINGHLTVVGGINKKRDGAMAITVSGGDAMFQGAVTSVEGVTIGEPAAENGKRNHVALSSACATLKLDVTGSGRLCGNLNVSGTSNLHHARIEHLNVTSSMVMSNKTSRLLRVGPTRLYKTITAALDSFRGAPVGNTTIFVDPGVYTESVDIGEGFSSTAGYHGYEGTDENYDVPGLSIIGDQRAFAGITYANGRKLPFQIQNEMIVSTNVNGVGPFSGINGEFAQPVAVTALGALVDDGVAPIRNACETPFANNVTGKIAILQRGQCAFLAKALNAEANGAVAVITYMASGAAPITMGGGVTGQLPYADVMISLADATILNAALAANPNMQITITPIYYPIGLKGAVPTFVRPNPNQLQVLTNAGLVNFGAIGLTAGDKVQITAYDDTVADRFDGIHHYVVQSVLGNTITFTTTITSLVTSPHATMTLLPNVAIRMPAIGKPSLLLRHSQAYLRGLVFEDNPAFERKEGSETAYFSHATAILSNVVFDSSNAETLTIAECSHSHFYGESFSTTIGYTPDVVSFLGGNIFFYGSLVQTSGSFSHVLAKPGFFESKAYISEGLQTILSGDLGNFNDGGVTLFNSELRAGYLDLGGATGDTAALYLDFGSKVSVFGKVSMEAGNPFGGVFGIYAFGGSQLSFNDEVSFKDIFLPIWLVQGSRLIAGANVVFDGNEGLKYMVSDSSSMDFTWTSTAPQNQLSHAANGAIDPYFKTQLLTTGALVMTLEASTSSFWGDYSFINPHAYIVVNVNGGAHEIHCLDCHFVGKGIGGTKSVLNFNTKAGATVELHVVAPDTVVVMEDESATFSTKKREEMPAISHKLRTINDMKPKMAKLKADVVRGAHRGSMSSGKKAQK